MRSQTARAPPSRYTMPDYSPPPTASKRAPGAPRKPAYLPVRPSDFACAPSSPSSLSLPHPPSSGCSSVAPSTHSFSTATEAPPRPQRVPSAVSATALPLLEGGTVIRDRAYAQRLADLVRAAERGDVAAQESVSHVRRPERRKSGATAARKQKRQEGGDAAKEDKHGAHVLHARREQSRHKKRLSEASQGSRQRQRVHGDAERGTNEDAVHVSRFGKRSVSAASTLTQSTSYGSSAAAEPPSPVQQASARGIFARRQSSSTGSRRDRSHREEEAVKRGEPLVISVPSAFPEARAVAEARERRIPDPNDIDDWSDATSTVGTESFLEGGGLRAYYALNSDEEDVGSQEAALFKSWVECMEKDRARNGQDHREVHSMDSEHGMDCDATADNEEARDATVASVAEAYALLSFDEDNSDRGGSCDSESSGSPSSDIVLDEFDAEHVEESQCLSDSEVEEQLRRQRIGRVSGQLSLGASIYQEQAPSGNPKDYRNAASPRFRNNDIGASQEYIRAESKLSQSSSAANWRFQDAEEEDAIDSTVSGVRIPVVPSSPVTPEATEAPKPHSHEQSRGRDQEITGLQRMRRATSGLRGRSTSRRARGSAGEEVSCFPGRFAISAAETDEEENSDEEDRGNSKSPAPSMSLSDDAYDTFCRNRKEKPRRHSYITRLICGQVVAENRGNSNASSPVPLSNKSW